MSSFTWLEYVHILINIWKIPEDPFNKLCRIDSITYSLDLNDMHVSLLWFRLWTFIFLVGNG